jgi:hypothetical protein
MPPRARLAFACAAVLAAFCGAIASTAAADRWFVNGTALASSAALAKEAPLTSEWELEIHPAEASNKIKLKCKGPMLIVAGGISALDNNWVKELIFHGCQMVEPEDCSTADLIETGELVSLAELSTRGDLLSFKAKTGNTLFFPTFEGVRCSIAGEHPTNGQFVTRLAPGATEQTTQALEFLGSIENNSIEIFGAKVYLRGVAKLELTSKAKWSFHA